MRIRGSDKFRRLFYIGASGSIDVSEVTQGKCM